MRKIRADNQKACIRIDAVNSFSVLLDVARAQYYRYQLESIELGLEKRQNYFNAVLLLIGCQYMPEAVKTVPQFGRIRVQVDSSQRGFICFRITDGAILKPYAVIRP